VLAALFAATVPSKVPFYIAGGLLALWAVVLAAIGLTQPTFPYNDRGARGVMLLSFVLIVIAIGAGVLTDP
jgi:hypothetical protein